MAVIERDRLLWNFLSKYLLILVLPIALGAILYAQAMNNSTAAIARRHRAVLEQARATVDDQLRQIHDIMVQMDQNPRIRKLFTAERPVSGSLPAAIMDGAQEVHSQVITSDFVIDFQVYLRNSEVLITSSSTFIRLDLYYRSFFRFGDETYDEWRLLLDRHRQRSAMPAVDVWLDGQAFRAIPYMQSIPLSIVSRSHGTIVFFVDEARLLRLFASIDLSNGGTIAISDGSGRVLASSGRHGETEADPSGPEVASPGESTTTVVSDVNGWQYSVSLPRAAIIAEVRLFRRLALLVIALVVAIGVLLAYLFAYRNSIPIRELVSLTEDYGEYEDDSYPYHFLRHTIAHLLDDNAIMNSSLARQKQMLANALVYRLMRGEFTSTAEMEPVLRHSGVELDGTHFVVLMVDVLHVDSVAKIDALLESVRAWLRSVNSRTVGVHFVSQPLEHGVLGIIASCRPVSEESCRELVDREIREIAGEVEGQFGLQLRYAGGSFQEALIDVNRSYEEAKQVLAYHAMHPQWPGHWFSQIEQTSLTYYYPFHMEFRLANAVKAGDTAQTTNLLQQIKSENLEVRDIPPAMARDLVANIRQTAIRIIDESHGLAERAGLVSELRSVESEPDPIHALNTANRIMIELCEKTRDRADSHNLELRDRIVRTIEGTFRDPDLGLSSLAETFEMNQSYLSRFFKEQTGENISAFIERIRLTSAEAMLKQGVPVSRVFAEVGYRSTSVFRRAYKRYFGIQAGAVRPSSVPPPAPKAIEP